VVARRLRFAFCASLIVGTAAPLHVFGQPAPAPARKAVSGRMVAPKGHPADLTPPRRDTATEPREAKDPGNPHEQRVAKLRERLLEVLREAPLNRTRVGVEVMQASDGDVLFAHNAAVPFNPASNTKMLTTAAAMTFLGGDWRYHTVLYGPAPDSEGVVKGDVVLRGSGDPSLTNTDVAEIARDLARRGITKIEGDLYADPRFHDPRGSNADAGVGEGAIILNRNTYAVHVRPGEVGHGAVVWVEPRTEVFGVENQATTVKGKRSRLRIDSYRKDDRLIITVRGRIAENRGEYVDLRRLADGALLAGAVLRSALNDFGIELTGDLRSGSVSARSSLGEHVSAPLSDVCKISNKPSNNFVAEAIYKTLGGELYGLPGTLAKGTRAVMDYLSAAGIKGTNYKIVNGSGLTHENRITARDLAALLRTIYYDPAVAPDFLTSLAIGGIDGTIRNRFMGTEAVGLVRAKTGTLSGVSALSGYVGDKDDVLVFSIFVQGFRNKRTNEVRHAQVRMVQAMLTYLRADAPNLKGEPTELPIEAPTDSESDGDPESGQPSTTTVE
jgi:D-alanyl-D-alanine carboxypeptidase/D-alanyl-D-alanine-endopeptidase (penicillin-binding protein 4)